MTNIRAQSVPEQEDSTSSDDIRGAKPAQREQALAHAKEALNAALDKKALEPVLLDVGDMCSYAEFILMVSGRSDRQVDAICDAIVSEMKSHGQKAIGVEGLGSGHWALIDYGDVIIHVFHHPIRQHYDLESLWIDAKRVDIEIPDDAKVSSDEYY